jgi:hypothetical protein
MTASYQIQTKALRQSLTALTGAGVIPAAAKALKNSSHRAGLALRAAVLDEVAAFSSSANPHVLVGLDQHGGEHIGELLCLFSGQEIGTFEFVKTHAHRRAEQHFPLEASLHAYRCGHRVLSHWLREAALATRPKDLEQAASAVADFAIEYTNVISSISAAEYVAHTRMLSGAEGDRRVELLNTLLSGYDESDGRVAQLLKRAGYLEQRQSYCIVVAQATNATEMENPSRVQRIATAITETLTGTSIRTLAGTRNNLVVAVLSDRRRASGWTAPQSSLADRVGPLLLTLGPVVLVGVSTDHPSTSFLPKALQEATMALEFASVANRVVQYSRLPIRDLLVHRGNVYVQSAPPPWLDAFMAANARAEGSLVQTLRAVADADMNVQKAARKLRRHPNTVYTRIEKIREVTSLDGQRYGDLTELLLAVDCWRM